MFVSVTPIKEDTGVPSGQPVLVNLDKVISVQLIAATAITVAHTRIIGVDGYEVLCSDSVETILPVPNGVSFRSY